ncbi:MAG: CvpA family protein [Candidatus Neomarinimicrobiota bacterium]
MSWFLDGLALIFILFLGYDGFNKGLIEELGRLVGLVLAILISISNTKILSNKIVDITLLGEELIVIFSFSFLFIITLLCMRLLTKMIHIAFLSPNNQLMNRSLGFTFGLIKGFFITMVFSWFIALLPLQKWKMVMNENSRFVKYGNEFRLTLVSFFNWDDPVSSGESYFKQLTQP